MYSTSAIGWAAMYRDKVPIGFKDVQKSHHSTLLGLAKHALIFWFDWCATWCGKHSNSHNFPSNRFRLKFVQSWSIVLWDNMVEKEMQLIIYCTIITYNHILTIYQNPLKVNYSYQRKKKMNIYQSVYGHYWGGVCLWPFFSSKPPPSSLTMLPSR